MLRTIMLKAITIDHVEGCYTDAQNLDHENNAGLQFAHVGIPLGHEVNGGHGVVQQCQALTA
jgi:hypothetical protein